MLDIDKLTLGEVATVEKLSGASINTLGDDEVPKGNMLAALAMIAKRRDGFPGFKFNDALALPMNEAMELIGIEDERPEDAASKAEWIAYAEGLDINVKGMSKADIIAAVDAHEEDTDDEDPTEG